MADTSEVTVKMPDGKPFSFMAPVGASDEDILAFAQQNYKDATTLAKEDGANSSWRGAFSVLQGPTFGFGDEIVGGINAAARFGNGKSVAENYKSGRDFARGAAEQEQRENPWLTNITRMASLGVLGPLAAPAKAGSAMTVAPSIGRNALNMATQGAKYGAVQGAGDSTAEDLGGVIKDSAWGAGTGAVLSPAFGGATSVLGAVGKRIGPPVLDKLGDAVEGVSGSGGWFLDKIRNASATMAGNQAQSKVAEAFARDYAALNEKVRNGEDPTGEIQRELAKLTKRAPLAAAGSKNTISLLDLNASMPGETGPLLQKTQRELQASRAPRMIAAADSALGTNGAKFAQTLDALDTARKTAAKPYYDALNGVSVRVDDDLYKLLQKTDIAHGEAASLYKQRTGNAIDLKQLQPGDDVPFGVLDDLKQSLWAYTDSLKTAGKGKLALPADNNRVALVKKLETLSPADKDGNNIYRMARDAYAGPSEMMSAAELGRTAMKGDVIEVAKDMRGFTASEREAFKVGALQALREKVGTQAGQTSLLKFWMEPTNKDKLKLLFGEKVNFQQFQKALAAEEKLTPIIRAGKGSESAPRFFGSDDLNVDPLLGTVGMVQSAAGGNPAGFANSVKRTFSGMQTPEPVRDQIGRILLSNGKEAQANLLAMQELTRRINANRAAQQQFYGGAAATAVPPGLFQSLLGNTQP